MSVIKRSCICAACIALCYVLPIAFHAAGIGRYFSPMHIPVLLCGMLCGWQYGLICGIMGPILSSVLTGMPPANMLITMLPELAIYGGMTGMLLRVIHTNKVYADLYLSMVPAMLLGRVIGGAAKALFYLSGLSGDAPYSIELWVSAYFVQTLPGTILQLVILPSLVFLLMKTRLIPERYPRQGEILNG